MAIRPAEHMVVERPLREALYFWAPNESLKPCYIARRNLELADDDVVRAKLDSVYRELRAEIERETWKWFCRDFFAEITGIRMNADKCRQTIPSQVALKLTPHFATDSAEGEDAKFERVRIRALAPLEIEMRFNADFWEPGRAAFRAVSADYRLVVHRGCTYALGLRQAKAIQRLHDAFMVGRPALSSKELMHEIAAKGHITDLFKSEKRNLIDLVDKSLVRLNVFEPS